MVQPQFESAAFGGGNTAPDLSNSDLIKKGMNRKSSSHFDGLLSMGQPTGGSAKDAALSKFHASSLRITATQKCDALLHPRSELSGKMIEAVHSYKDGITISEDRARREPSQSSIAGGSPVESNGSRSSSMMDTAPSMVTGAEPIVRIVGTVGESKGSATLDKPSEIAEKKPLDALSIKLERAFCDAERHARTFENQRIQRQAERDIIEIESGKRRFTTLAIKQEALESAKLKKTAADLSLRDSGPPRYAQTLKKLHDVTAIIETVCKAESNDMMMTDLVSRLEELMAPIDNIWNGIPGKTPDLARPSARIAESHVSMSERLAQIQKHLEAKINTVDGAQLQRISVVKDNKAFKEILRLHDAGELPKDGSLVFFTNDGLLLYQSELKVSQRSTQSRAKDAASAERHANNTPAFIDVMRLSQGLGPEGAGLWRFIGQETRIVGAAVLRPVMKDGKPVELPGARNGRGETMVKKEVALTIGEMPPEVTTNMAYGHLLNTLRAKKSALEKGIDPKARETFAPDSVAGGNARIQAPRS
jgi:hypothetical protein